MIKTRAFAVMKFRLRIACVSIELLMTDDISAKAELDIELFF